MTEPIDVIEGRERLCLMVGDCRDLLRLIPDNSIDSIVTDPPYEIGFSSKTWDKTGIAFDVDMWRECLRVLKPGGHVCAFGASRTYHRLACAIEDAGFEIRDCIEMLYGSGAQHALNASKAIDNMDGTAHLRPVVGSYTVSGNAGTSLAEKGGTFGVGVPNSDAKELFRTTGATERSQAWDGWYTNLAPGKEPVVLARKPLDGNLAENLVKWGVGAINIDATRIATDFGERGEAWKRSGHTANPDADKIGNPPGLGMLLHPKGRIAKNVIYVHDARCQKIGEREATAPIINRHTGGPRFFGDAVGAEFVTDGGEQTTETVWECHESCPVAKLSEQSGESKSRIGQPREGINGQSFAMTHTGTEYSDEGSAARYFTQLEWTEPDFDLWRYVKKPSTAIREAGCEQIESRRTTNRKPGSPGSLVAGAGAGRLEGRHNDHVALKPIDFVRWLIRLVTPVGGITLSPFVGSGTDAIAAQAEGVRSIGFDLEARNIEIAKARIAYWTEDNCRRLHTGAKGKLIKPDEKQTSIFDRIAGAK